MRLLAERIVMLRMGGGGNNSDYSAESTVLLLFQYRVQGVIIPHLSLIKVKCTRMCYN